MTTWQSQFHLLATCWMCAIIWYVQLVHYPTFHQISADTFRAFHTLHSRWTTVIVLPPMVSELVLSILACWREQNLRTITPLTLTLLTWALTFFVSVPLHERLGDGYELEITNRLIKTNWLRVFAWSALLTLQLA